MRYFYIVTITDGNLVVRAEKMTNLETAKQNFHHWCELLISDNSFSTGMVKLLDDNLDCVEGKMEFIQHEVQTTVETPTEPEE